MTDKHTPGPWKVYTAPDGVTMLGIGDAGGGGITDASFAMWRDGKEKMANARLAAAAPELLDALRLCEIAMDHMGDVMNGMDITTEEDVALTTPAFDAMRVAIAKATGTK